MSLSTKLKEFDYIGEECHKIEMLESDNARIHFEHIYSFYKAERISDEK